MSAKLLQHFIVKQPRTLSSKVFQSTINTFHDWSLIDSEFKEYEQNLKVQMKGINLYLLNITLKKVLKQNEFDIHNGNLTVRVKSQPYDKNLNLFKDFIIQLWCPSFTLNIHMMKVYKNE